MIIVAADTSTQTGSVALKVKGERVIERSLPEGRPHSETLLKSIDALLSGAGVNRVDVTALAVGVGPGAFTGLRVGLSTFKGWAAASGLKLAPIPSLDAVSHPLLVQGRSVLVCSDARKGELYAAFYPGLDGEGLPRREGEVALIKPSFLPEFCQERSVNEAEVVGSAVDLVRGILKELPALKAADSSHSHPAASVVLALGETYFLLGRGVDPRDLVPFYVRPPDVADPTRVS